MKKCARCKEGRHKTATFERPVIGKSGRPLKRSERETVCYGCLTLAEAKAVGLPVVL